MAESNSFFPSQLKNVCNSMHYMGDKEMISYIMVDGTVRPTSLIFLMK